MENILGKKYWLFLIVSLLLVGGFYLIKPEPVKAGSDDNLSGWAYSSNIGWISFNALNCAIPGTCIGDSCISGGYLGCPHIGDGYRNYGVKIESDGKLSGYAWYSAGENSGEGCWITFNRTDPGVGTPPAPPFNGAEDFLAYYQTTENGLCGEDQMGQVCGWARALCNGGGWEGWIKIKGSTHSVYLNTNTNEFHGYAFGGNPDGEAGNSVIGWLSWNCAEGGDDQPGGSNICPPVGNTDYKVVYNPSNEKPNQPNSLGETRDYCAFGKTPQVATNTTIILSWSSFSDPDGGDTQAAYEIWLDNDSGFPGSRFNYIADGSSSNESALNLIYDKEGDWLSGLNWGTTYYWKVRVKDDKGIWSDFSNFKSFTMPSHAYPEPAFSWSPDPPAVGEDVQFSNGTIFSDLICQNNPDNSSCGYYWTFVNADKLNSNQRELIIKFISMGNNKVTLKSTDSSGYFCEKSETISSKPPKPEWKEIPPTSRLLNGVKNVVANISNFFNKIFPI